MAYESEIRKAIFKEQEMYEFYIRLSKQSPKPNLSSFFLKLGMEELRHKRLLEIFKATDNFKESLETAYKENILDSLMGVDQSFSQYDDEELRSAWRLAIKKELETFGFYSELEQDVSSSQLKRLFSQLKSWELGHKLNLEKEYKRAYGTD